MRYHPDVISRAQGCLLGQIAGDNLGSLVEFQSAEAILQKYPQGVRVLQAGGMYNTLAGQPTDDSELALALARTLVRVGAYDENEVAKAYAEWYNSNPFDVGAATRMSFSSIGTKTPAQDAQRAALRETQANGAMMRISPLLADLARQDCRLSHPHVICQDANAVYAVAVSNALIANNPVTLYQNTLKWAERSEIHPAIMRWLKYAEKDPPEEYFRQMGWVRIAFQNAFYQLLHATSLEEGVVDTVMRGGDTDTNGAICGALLGALYGFERVPLQWRNSIQECRPATGGFRVFQPRPVAYWPNDVVELAAKLVDCAKS
jgi:ADP-ribosyl-[dinitrogen reductase] hydrolase